MMKNRSIKVVAKRSDYSREKGVREQCNENILSEYFDALNDDDISLIKFYKDEL